MALFDKCFEFKKMVDYVKSRNQFFYLREIDPAASPIVLRKGKKMIMLGSNNYLNLTEHPKVKEAAIKTIEKYGTGSCGSRILTGTTSIHTAMEKKLAEFKMTEDTITFSAGFLALMATISAITDENDIILSDELNHASIIEGCRLSRAQTKVYKHNDMASLEQELAKCDASLNKLIITDGVFSMKGDVADLPGIKKLADKYHAEIMVDDAHGTGVLGKKGRGTLEHFDMEGKVGLISGTFSKSFAAVGGFTGAKTAVIEFLKLTSRPFIFTASMPPSVAATILASIEVIEQEPEIIQKLHANSNFLKRGLKEMGYIIEETITPIIPILINNDEKTFMMAGLMEQEGVFVNPVIPPAVPKNQSIIRVSLTAGHTENDLGMALEKFKLVGKKLNLI
jgi:8-amino-7-oxononanoate synthase